MSDEPGCAAARRVACCWLSPLPCRPRGSPPDQRGEGRRSADRPAVAALATCLSTPPSLTARRLCTGPFVPAISKRPGCSCAPAHGASRRQPLRRDAARARRHQRRRRRRPDAARCRCRREHHVGGRRDGADDGRAHRAAWRRRGRCIVRGANVNAAETWMGETALMWAAAEGPRGDGQAAGRGGRRARTRARPRWSFRRSRSTAARWCPRRCRAAA